MMHLPPKESVVSGEPAAPFSHLLLEWFDVQGRHNLPWQSRTSSYPIWLSEVMLQQTQVTTVIPYYQRFMARFPDMATLAAAPLDDVLAHWAGLGYYTRARNLHRCAQQLCRDHEGVLPADLDLLTALPGIGRSTAGAILAFAHGQCQPILDGNVRRILCRYFAIEGWPGTTAIQARLWALATQLTPSVRVGDYTQGMMDLGAMVCRRGRPDCAACPLSPGCLAYRQGRVDTLPTPRPRKVLPERQVVMLLMDAGPQGILLEQRPPTGIWGGLWSFPEHPVPVPGEADFRDWCQERFGLLPGTWHSLPVLRHRFTHFVLDITPLHVHVVPGTVKVMEPPRSLWYTRPQRQGNDSGDNDSGDAISTPAMPTPIRRLLTRIGRDPGQSETVTR